MTTPGRLGDYEVLRRIGTGGMAEIFLCTKRGAKGTEKRLVVKRLLPQHAKSDRLRTMFVHEAHLAIRLAHPNLVHCYELADDPEGGLLLAMEYVDGADLGRILSEMKKRGARLPDVVALRIVEQAARGLHYAHEYRDEDAAETLAIVHRDISPQNILVSRGGVVKVADLGVASARFVRDETGVQPGKLRYMSPEQARGEKVDRRCDVYALGVVLYELFCVRSPYAERKGAALARAVTHGKLDPPLAKVNDIPEDVRPILEGALAADPSRRTRTARELADSIAQVIFARGSQVDEQTVEAALAPLISSADKLGSSSRGSISEDAISAGVSANSGASSSSSSGGSARVTDDPSSDSGSDSDDVATVAAAPRARPREGGVGAAGLRPGDAFDRYVLEGRIGHGGMAEVFRARDTRLRREVALKLLRTDSDAASRSRMLVEAQSAATFEHPGSVVVFDVGEHDGVPFIAMELIRGRTLSTYIGEAEVPIARRIRWSVAIARVLAAAHRTGLVHRDVKPSNVMIKEDGEVKVLDFGIVRRRIGDGTGTNVDALTAAGSIIGTPGYASPEQLRGDPVDGRADQFSWAVTTYEILSGRRPWGGDSTGVVVAQMLLEPFVPLAPLAPEVPPPVVAVIERALQREPDERFASMEEIADALAPFCEPEPVPAARGPYASYSSLPMIGDSSTTLPRPPGIPDSLYAVVDPPPRAAWRLKWAVSFAAAALLGGLAAFFLTRGPGPDPDHSASSAASPAGGARVPVVPALKCQPAEIESFPPNSASPGSALDPEIPRALGVGACARLAVELGVPWAVLDSPHALRVRLTTAGDATVRADLDLDGESAAGSAREPMRAIDLAVAALRPKLAAPPLTAAEIQAWGANDEAGARRIARVFRRRDLRVTADIATDAVRLLETDGDSPFSHLLSLMISAGSSDVLAKARERTLERLDRLPLSRQHLVRGLLMAYPAEVDRKEAARLIRQSYAEAPDDTEMVGLYITVGTRLGLPEAFGVLDRLIGSAPTHCVVPLENAILRAADDDVERTVRYAEKWIDILPEARASWPVVQAYLRAGKLTEARRGVDFGRALGLNSMAEPITYEGGLVDIDLVGLDTSRARDRARSMLADPRPFARSLGAEALVTAHFLDGHVRDASAAIASGVKLSMDSGDVEGTALLLTRALSASRWLGRAQIEPAQIDWLAQKAAAQDQLLRFERAAALVEIALAVKGPDADRARRSALSMIETEAAAAGDDRVLRDDLLLQTIPLVRVVRGDKAAIAVFREAERARSAVRIRSHVDVGLAFEALGEPLAATKAYAIFMDPAQIRRAGVERMIASVRLHNLGSAAGPAAAAFAPLYEKLQTTADPGLIDAITKLK